MSQQDQLKMHSPNLVDQNIDKIAALFPNCITEAQGENGEIKKAVEERIELIQQKMQLEYNLTFEAEYQRRVGSLNWWKLWNDWREYSKKNSVQRLLK